LGFLERVQEEKSRELAAKKRRLPLERLREQLTTTTVRNFRRAVGGGQVPTRIIAELKARTPSIRTFPQSNRLDELAVTYERHGAAAISVVTDEANFGTSLATAKKARAATALPVLVKDFVVDPYQLYEARAAGADAVLLIVRLLDDRELAGLIDLAGSLGMDALVETHNDREIRRATAAGAAIVGINNRDLDTLEVSLDTTRRLADTIPPGVVKIAESGIHSRGDIESLAKAGIDAYLIGGRLLQSQDPGRALRELRGERE
jgi:indole-3-glycerol phosphate synthase